MSSLDSKHVDVKEMPKGPVSFGSFAGYAKVEKGEEKKEKKEEIVRVAEAKAAPGQLYFIYLPVKRNLLSHSGCKQTAGVRRCHPVQHTVWRQIIAKRRKQREQRKRKQKRQGGQWQRRRQNRGEMVVS